MGGVGVMLTDNSSTNWDNHLCSQLWHCQGWEHFIITRAKRHSCLPILNWYCFFGEQLVTNYSHLSGTYCLIFISLLCIERTGSVVLWSRKDPGAWLLGSSPLVLEGWNVVCVAGTCGSCRTHWECQHVPGPPGPFSFPASDLRESTRTVHLSHV